MQQLLF